MSVPSKFKKKYWEREQAKVVTLGRNVFKLFIENGKIQVYPRIDSAPNGVGRGATIDIETMTKTERNHLVQIIQYAVDNFNKNKKPLGNEESF